MNENLKKLLEKLAQNPELKAELEKNPPKSAEDVIAVAARLGVELTKEELEDKELSLDNADQLDGGYFAGSRIICGSVSNEPAPVGPCSFHTFQGLRPNENGVCPVAANNTEAQ